MSPRKLADGESSRDLNSSLSTKNKGFKLQKQDTRTGRDRNGTMSPVPDRGRNKKAEEEKPGRASSRAKKRQEATDDFKGLSQEYPSFELLWFDIMTKSRHLI
jgi:hypothetical protein